MFEDTLRERLHDTHVRRDGEPGIAISIKVRSCGGCFDRGCCPTAWDIIQPSLDRAEREQGTHDPRHNLHLFQYHHHESGPEFLVWLALGTAGIALAKSVLDLVTTIIKARAEGQKKGDRHREPIVLIVRGFDADGKMYDEKVLHFDAGETATREAVEKALKDGIQKHLLPSPPQAKSKPIKKKATTKKVKRR